MRIITKAFDTKINSRFWLMCIVSQTIFNTYAF